MASYSICGSYLLFLLLIGCQEIQETSYIINCGSYSSLIVKQYNEFHTLLKLVPAICVYSSFFYPASPLSFRCPLPPILSTLYIFFTCTPYIFYLLYKIHVYPQKKYSAFKNIIQNCLRFRK